MDRRVFFLIHRSHSISFTRAQGIPRYKIGFGREKDGRVDCFYVWVRGCVLNHHSCFLKNVEERGGATIMSRWGAFDDTCGSHRI